jgi:hypothetical protein
VAGSRRGLAALSDLVEVTARSDRLDSGQAPIGTSGRTLGRWVLVSGSNCGDSAGSGYATASSLDKAELASSALYRGRGVMLRTVVGLVDGAVVRVVVVVDRVVVVVVVVGRSVVVVLSVVVVIGAAVVVVVSSSRITNAVRCTVATEHRVVERESWRPGVSSLLSELFFRRPIVSSDGQSAWW